MTDSIQGIDHGRARYERQLSRLETIRNIGNFGLGALNLATTFATGGALGPLSGGGIAGGLLGGLFGGGSPLSGIGGIAGGVAGSLGSLLGGGGGGLDKESLLLLQMQIQEETLMYTSYSNLLKADHDARMNAVRNLRS